MKPCTRCKQLLPLSQFSKGHHLHGRNHWCKGCDSRRHKENAEAARRRRAARDAALRRLKKPYKGWRPGMCLTCTADAKPGRMRCEFHLAYISRQTARHKKKLRRDQPWRCLHCRQPAEPGKTRCRKHLDANNEGKRARYAARRAAGRCTACGVPAGGSQLCILCHHKRKKKAAARRAAAKAKHRAGA